LANIREATTLSKASNVSLLLQERMNLFYLLVFVPLLIFAYFHSEWLFSIIILVFGSILLLIKKQDLELFQQAKPIHKVLGLLIVLGSFFIFYSLVPFLPSITFYTAANYAVYLLGLCLIFFEPSALKAAASSIFLIAAGASSPFISDWLEQPLSPYITVQFAYMIQSIMNLLGVKAIILESTSDPLISFPASQGGQVTAVFNWYCVGVSSLLIFSTILVILLIEEHSDLGSRITWSIIGISGMLVLNVFRVVIILLADYFYGAEVGGTIHYVIGYTLFIAWLIIFLYIFSKKAVIAE
jgi:exosortase/archaeosortase family protein